jgi:hypothetical protein
MEAVQRPTLRLSAPQSAPISFGQFGNQNLAQLLNLGGGLGVPPLPLSPLEISGLLGPLGGGGRRFGSGRFDDDGELFFL